jgi:hypothetical protein
MKNADLVGTKINGLKIIDYFSKGKRQYFKCHCICGFDFKSRTDAIKSGATKSCGCLTGDFISEKNKLSNNLGAINLVKRHYKNNAAKRKLLFKLSDKEFENFISDNCYYCGSSPKLTKFTSSAHNRRDKEIAYNGIDRINNSIGYTSDNCVTCCTICNGAKSDLSFEEFKDWIQKIVRHNVK